MNSVKGTTCYGRAQGNTDGFIPFNIRARVQPFERGRDMAKLTQVQKGANLERADRGQAVVDFYGHLPGADPDAVMTDMLADLMHYCAVEKMSFYEALQSAQMHFNAEMSGEY